MHQMGNMEPIDIKYQRNQDNPAPIGGVASTIHQDGAQTMHHQGIG